MANVERIKIQELNEKIADFEGLADHLSYALATGDTYAGRFREMTERQFKEIVSMKSEIQRQKKNAYGFLVVCTLSDIEGYPIDLVVGYSLDWEAAMEKAAKHGADFILAVNQTGYLKMVNKLKNKTIFDDSLWYDFYATPEEED